MDITPTPAALVTAPYRAARLAPWTQHSRKAVGRSRRAGVEVAIGTGAVEVGSRLGSYVSFYLAEELTDEQMRTLALAEDYNAPLPALTDALRLLQKLGLKPMEIASVLGLPDRAEVSRLTATAAMPQALLGELGRLGLTRNHARWLLGIDEATALAALRSLEVTARRKPPSARRRQNHPFQTPIPVSAVRDWRRGFDAEAKAAQEDVAPTPAVDPVVALHAAGEAERISRRLGAATQLEPLPTPGTRRLRLAFYSAEELSGLMQQLGRASGEGPPPMEGAGRRWLTIDGITDDELAYLVGRSDD